MAIVAFGVGEANQRPNPEQRDRGARRRRGSAGEAPSPAVHGPPSAHRWLHTAPHSSSSSRRRPRRRLPACQLARCLSNGGGGIGNPSGDKVRGHPQASCRPLFTGGAAAAASPLATTGRRRRKAAKARHPGKRASAVGRAAALFVLCRLAAAARSLLAPVGRRCSPRLGQPRRGGGGPLVALWISSSSSGFPRQLLLLRPPPPPPLPADGPLKGSLALPVRGLVPVGCSSTKPIVLTKKRQEKQGGRGRRRRGATNKGRDGTRQSRGANRARETDGATAGNAWRRGVLSFRPLCLVPRFST